MTAYKKYLVLLLMAILASNFLDRLALGIVLQDIKAELDVSDTQLGFLTGIAFAAFYAVMGLPLARWADRGNRVTIVTVTTALWSVAVATCGLATSFVQLLLIRIGVAVGESGCVPTGQSLIAEHFSRAERPKANAIYMMGNPASLIVGYLAAGWLNELYGWRVMFMILSLPGLVLAALAWFTLKEPRRETPVPVRADHSLQEVCSVLLSNRTFGHLLIGYSLVYFFNYGLMPWQPAFFMRSHGLTSGELGTWFAAIFGLGGLLGTYWGGDLATRYAVNNEKLQLAIIAVGFAVLGIAKACVFLAPTATLAFVFLAVAIFGGSMANGPLFATLQTLVPERMRATAVAVVFLFCNLIGMGLGPLTAGALSDGLRPWFGDHSLRYALVALCPGFLWASCHLWWARRTVSRDIAAAQVESVPPIALSRTTQGLSAQ